MNYYFFSPKNRRSVAVACAPENTPPAYQLVEGLLDVDALSFELTLKKLLFRSRGVVESDDLTGVQHVWCDFQPNSLAWPIMSPQLRDVIDQNVTEEDAIDWVKVLIRQGSMTARPYYLLRFKTQKDVLNVEATVYAGADPPFVAQPVFAAHKIAPVSVFCVPEDDWQISHGVYVSEKIKKAAKKAGLTGLNFELTTKVI